MSFAYQPTYSPSVRAVHDAHISRRRRLSARPIPTVVDKPADPPPEVKAPEQPVIKKPKRITVDAIVRTVAKELGGVDVDAVYSRSRKGKLVKVRQTAAYLARTMIVIARQPMALIPLGEKMGGRDHTTIMWAIRSTSFKVLKDKEFAARVAAIRIKLEIEHGAAA